MNLMRKSVTGRPGPGPGVILDLKRVIDHHYIAVLEGLSGAGL
jgi:hypothetical protein